MVRQRNGTGGRRGEKMFPFPIITVRVLQKKETDRDRGDMMLVRVQRATCGLTLAHLGCQSFRRRGYLSPSGPPPAVLMNLLRPWEWLMHLFIETGKQVAAKFTSSSHFLGGTK